MLELAPDAPPQTRAGALALAGRLASELRLTERARSWYEESLPLARIAGDRVQEAWVLHGLGFVAALEGDRPRGRELLEQSLALFIELGEHAPAGGRLTYLAWLAQQEGDLVAARDCLERSLAEYREAGDESGIVGSLQGLGEIALQERDWRRALELFGVALDGPLDSPLRMYLFAGIGAVAAATGRGGEAARLWGAAERIGSTLDLALDPTSRAQYEALLGALDPAAVDAGAALSEEEGVALARAVIRSSETVGGAVGAESTTCLTQND